MSATRSGRCSPTCSRRAPRRSGPAGRPAPRPGCWASPPRRSTAARGSASPSSACSCARSAARALRPARSARRWSAGCCTLVALRHAGAAGDLRPPDRRRRPARRPGPQRGRAWRCPSEPATRLEDDRRDRPQARRPGVRRPPGRRPPCCWSPPPTRSAARSSCSSTRPSDGVTRTDHAELARGRAEATYDFDGAPVLGVLGRRRRRRAAPARGRRAAAAGRRPAGRSARPDRGLRQGAGAVRPPARRVPGRGDADGRRLRRLADGLPGRRRGDAGASPRASRPTTTSRSGAFWFCDRAPAALQTCHHLHGGMGVDETYPLHRYFARVKDVARLLGGAEAALAAVPARRVRRGAQHRAHRRAARLQGRGPRLLRRAGLRRGPARDDERPARRGLPPHHQADGRRRLDGCRLAGGVRRQGARRHRAADLRQRGRPGRRTPARGDAADRRADPAGLRHREAEGPCSSRRSWPATCTSRSATPRPTPAPTSRRCARRPRRTATTTSSTARRCGPPAGMPPTTSGWPCAPTPTPPSTRASRC